MPEKTRILGTLNEQALLLPSLVNAALSANDRVKYRFTLLQSAQAHAERPERPFSNLRTERLAAGVEDSRLDNVVAESVGLGKGRYRIPAAAEIVQAAYEDAAEMLEPLKIAAVPEAGTFSGRLDVLRKNAPVFDEADVLTADELHAITSGTREADDSLHLLVMDMHHALNALQARLAGESIDGCRAYGIGDADRPLIAAFMAGVNRTAPLKFEHPGLSATATRVGDKLVLQNDIGTTDAHVLVVHVVGRKVTVTYTDVHLPRLLFFQSLFERFDVRWEDTRSRKDAAMEEGVYHLCVGNFAARSPRQLRDYLEHLGSRLVFLIDWNRARTRLRMFVSRNEAIDLLKWAADHDIGHMAWLKAGGEQLLFDAMGFAFGGRILPGQKLDDLLPPGQAVVFLRFCLSRSLERLGQGRPSSLIEDEIRTELASLVRSSEDALLDAALEHAGLIVELSDTVRMTLDAVQKGRSAEVERMAERAKVWETAADGELNAVRGKRAEGDNFMVSFLGAADDIADELEEAVFHITLSPKMPMSSITALERLIEPVARAGREFVKALAASRHARRGVPREDMEDFLQAVYAIRTMEHASDLAEREVKRILARDNRPFSEVLGVVEAARNLERAADGLMHVALLLRDHVLGRVIHD
jgi:uncharacterized protein Yka (UPF0111/DUF47 family)